MFAVTQATDKHLESVIQLDLEVLGSTIRREFLVASVNKGNVWVALNDYDVVGFVVVDNVFFGHPFIELLIVHPGFRRKRIGAMLVEAIELRIETEKLFTSTNQSNTPMQSLCESLGFQQSGYIENLDEGDPEIVYFKRIGVSDGV
ncbi:GNAT family N-acetyltransferase [Alicyclobacillus fastidiosus]|uniref:GNAT family N-acetyltransferase n=1 Tax=Alicyclobacillus fastidiosus TaxID=392011 RepID=A0ABV5ADT6_9BACL|nr:GNAT family N-acetyltransferase [Alicyclobacillus fastidiosus]WEH11291.1 GNAT family N-acetyltransferase [Alicyclobacillus fastidiosus]